MPLNSHRLGHYASKYVNLFGGQAMGPVFTVAYGEDILVVIAAAPKRSLPGLKVEDIWDLR
jgi:hypothetical protein